MAFVSVPRDLTKVKNKIILNLTRTSVLFPVKGIDWSE